MAAELEMRIYRVESAPETDGAAADDGSGLPHEDRQYGIYGFGSWIREQKASERPDFDPITAEYAPPPVGEYIGREALVGFLAQLPVQETASVET